MLHLAIIGIVCAVSAPSEGIAITGRDNNESNAFYRVDREAKSVSPRVCNVDAHNSSVCATQKITNRTSSFRCGHVNIQYQNSRISSRSVMENVSSGEGKEFPDSNVGMGFRKRSLLWVDTNPMFAPKTLRPPLAPLYVPMECQPKKAKKLKCTLSKCDRLMFRLKEIKRMLTPSLNQPSKGLDHEMKKNFLRLKKINGRAQKRNLERVRVDDELDLNKRIQKLVEEIAIDNQRTTGETTPPKECQECQTETPCPQGKPKKVMSCPFIKKIKKLFKKCKKEKNKNRNMRRSNSGSVLQISFMRGSDRGTSGGTNPIVSHDVFKNVQKTRFRRNFPKQYKPCTLGGNSIFSDLNLEPSSYSSYFRTKSTGLYPFKQKLFSSNRNKPLLKLKGMIRRPYKSKIVYHLRPVFKDRRWKRHYELPEDVTLEDTTGKTWNAEKTTKTEEQITKESENEFDSPSQEHSITEYPTLDQDEEAKEIAIDHSLERPFLKRNIKAKFPFNKSWKDDLQSYKERYNLMLDFPFFRSNFHPREKFKSNFLPNKCLSVNRYLKIRHALRHYLVKNNVMGPPRLPLPKRNKRYCGDKCCCSVPHKCWRSPPLLCIPYIKKGQDDLLRYLVRAMQRMVGRPFPPKADIFDSTKFKPCSREDHSCDDDCDDECQCQIGPRLTIPLPLPPPPPPPPLPNQNSCPCPCSCQMDATAKFCPCAQLNLCPVTPYRNLCHRVRPMPQQNYPFGNYPSPSYASYPANPLYAYPHGKAEQVYRPTPPNCDYNEYVLSGSVPYMPSNPYDQNSMSTPASPPLSSPYSPTPAPEATPQVQEQAPLTYTQRPSEFPSTQNACSWYVSKSPVERTEYFAYTALPYNVQPGNAPPPSQPLQSMQPQAAAPVNPANSRLVYEERSPAQINQQPVPAHSPENQCKDNFKKDSNSVLTNRLKKEENEQRNFESNDNFKGNFQNGAKCDDQDLRFSENQMPKPESSYGYSKNKNKENVPDSFKSDKNDRPLPKANAVNEFAANSNKENAPDIFKIDPPHIASNPLNQLAMHDANVPQYGNKISNGQEPFGCRDQESHERVQQSPNPTGPEMTDKCGKNLSKDNAYSCPPHQNTLGERLRKPDIDDDVDDRRFFKTKHHKPVMKTPKKPTTGLFQAYDDYYDKYPLYEQGDGSSLRLNKSPFLRSWRGYSKKVRKSPTRDMLTRRKREKSYYASPETFENYYDYDGEELSDDSQSPDVDPNWTPPSYEMFSELAKAVTEFDNSSSESVTSGLTMSSTILSVGELADKVDEDVQKGLNYTGDAAAPSKFLNQPSELTATDSGETTTDDNATTDVGDADRDDEESIDSKKSGKTGFFQRNSKGLSIQGSHSATTKKSSGAKESGGGGEDSDGEEAQIPTTLRAATIVKGVKKQMTKPSPKVYTKVYPDSLALDAEANETMTVITATTAKATIEKATQAQGSSPNIQLQLLAVCEGYLEVVKLIKAQNLTLAEDLDADLARYCENIISQNFNLQSDSSKPKKQESVSASKPTQRPTPKTTANFFSIDSYPDDASRLRSRIVVDVMNNPMHKRELDEDVKKGNSGRKKKRKQETDKDADDEKTEAHPQREKFRLKTGKNRESDLNISTESCQKKKKRPRRKEETEEETLQRAITKEQKELLNLLKKRKKALLSWLYNWKESPVRPNDARETEYFEDEEDIAPGPDISSYSGTIAPKEREETSKSAKGLWNFVNESVFPVYAKQYGYDKGGQLTEVEVLWRRIDEKTHRKQIFKNLSVLALLLDSTGEPKVSSQDNHILGGGLENEEVSEIQSKNEGKEGLVGSFEKKSSTAATVSKICCLPPVNRTHTFISRPDPKLIVGAPPNSTPCHPNVSPKVSHKFDAAKGLFQVRQENTGVRPGSAFGRNLYRLLLAMSMDIGLFRSPRKHRMNFFQEYSIEFLNYAVYILPAMFTVLFILCCLCCAMQILKSSKTLKKNRKKKKRLLTTESETTEESELETKTKRREGRRKKHATDDGQYDRLDKKRCRAFWNYLSRNKPNVEFGDGCSTEKKKSFLRFLKVRKDQGNEDFSSRYATVREDEGNCEEKPHHSSDREEAKNPLCDPQERRELIALLEELKKIDNSENSGEKKEVKSVHVQYMTQEDDAPVFRRPEFAFPYQKNVFGMPKGCFPGDKHFPFYRSDPSAVGDYELFDDVNELKELLPADSNYYSKRNDYLRRCDFEVNQDGGCKSFIKIFRDAGVTRKPFREKNLFKSESENRSFIFNKYRSISTDTSEELMGVRQKLSRTAVPKADNACGKTSPFALEPKKNGGGPEETDSLKRELSSKKHVRLKDNGVLCRL